VRQPPREATAPGNIDDPAGVPMFAFRDQDGNGMEIVEQR
jgi:hypothetical protein